MLAWHAQVTWIRGGFARMTIFFVLSGFLAAQSYARMLAKQPEGAFRKFWKRRARRLLPTTLLGVALAIVVTVTVGTVDARRDLAGDVWSTLANVANWRFIAAGRPYGALFERPSSLQHFWSLAVEEQCFWAMPLILALCGRGIGRSVGQHSGREALVNGQARQRRLVLLCAALLAMIPVLVRLDPDTVYYGTHVRGAEFLVGVWLGLWLAPNVDGVAAPSRMRLARTTGPIGLAILAVVMLTVDRNQTWLYRGGLAIFAIPAAAAVAGAYAAAPGLRQVLALPVFRLPGRWALSVYALHWPLFQVLGRWLPDANRALLVAAKFAVAMLAGAVAYRWFEQPLSINRVRRVREASGFAVWWQQDRLALSSIGAVVVALSLLATTVHRPAPEIDFAAAQKAQEQAVAAAPVTTASDAEPPDVTTPVATATPERVGMFGSSSGLLLGFTMKEWVQTHSGWTDVGGDTGLGCGFLVQGRRLEPVNDRPDGRLLRPGPECDWRSRWATALERGQPSLAIVIPGRWDATDWVTDGSNNALNLTDPAFAAVVESQIGEAVDMLHDGGAKRVVLTTVPKTGPGRTGDIPAQRDFPGDDPARIKLLNDLILDVANEHPFVQIVDLAAWADSLTPERHAELFPDGIHTNREQGPEVWSEFLGPAIDAATTD